MTEEAPMPATAAPASKTLTELRAVLDAANARARAKFAADWGGLSPEEAVRVAIANAHLFRPRARRP